MKKFISVFLVVIMVSLTAVPALATEAPAAVLTQSIITPQFMYISSIVAGLDIDSSGKATCAGIVTLSNNTYRVNMTVALQKKSGTSWSTIKSWTSSGTGNWGTSLEEFYYVVSGTYRVAVTAKVYNTSGTLVETFTGYSSIVYY